MPQQSATDSNTKSTSFKDLDMETAELLWNAVASGATLKDVRGIPEDVMEGLYAHAYEFYQQGRAKDAEVIFRFLSMYDSYNADYVMGLAASLQQQKQYEKALNAYTMAFAIAENDYLPMLHAGQCHLLMKNKESARSCFSAIVDSTATEAIKAKAQVYLAMLKPSNSTTKTEEKSHV